MSEVGVVVNPYGVNPYGVALDILFLTPWNHTSRNI